MNMIFKIIQSRAIYTILWQIIPLLICGALGKQLLTFSLSYLLTDLLATPTQTECDYEWWFA